MKTMLQSEQMTFEDLLPAVVPAPAVEEVVAAALDVPAMPVMPYIRTTTKLVGQPFISPIANIPTNRTPLSPTIKLR